MQKSQGPRRTHVLLVKSLMGNECQSSGRSVRNGHSASKGAFSSSRPTPKPHLTEKPFTAASQTASLKLQHDGGWGVWGEGHLFPTEPLASWKGCKPSWQCYPKSVVLKTQCVFLLRLPERVKVTGGKVLESRWRPLAGGGMCGVW